MRNKIISKVENSQIRKDLPNFGPGDTINVHGRIVENNKTRIQQFEGVVIRVRGSGLRKTFTLRKVSYGVAVEKTYPLNSPTISKIDVIKEGLVRRARIYYIREKSGKDARIKTKVKKTVTTATKAKA